MAATRYVERGAGAALNKLPRVALEIDGRGALAGGSRAGGTIVLALQSNTVALLLMSRDGSTGFSLRQRCGGGHGRKRRGNRTGEQNRTHSSFQHELSPFGFVDAPVFGARQVFVREGRFVTAEIVTNA